MHRTQLGPSPSTSSGSLKRHPPSPELAYSQSSAPVSFDNVSRRRTKRNKASQEAQNRSASAPHPIQSVSRPKPSSLVKSAEGRVALTTADCITEQTGPPNVIHPIIVLQPSVQPPTFSGNFDLYGMYLPFLTKLCLPPGGMAPDYSAVYYRILTSQAKHDYTARCFLAPVGGNSVAVAPPLGRFESSSILDPILERPFDITLDAFTYKKSLTYTPSEQTSLQAPEYSIAGPGLVGRTGLPVTCGIKGAKGVFKIKRVWTKQENGLLRELFEGFFSFSVCYDSMYRKGGHGNGAKYKFAFWGVRAMRDNTGKEIGMGPGRSW